jgi:hypothetical protein
MDEELQRFKRDIGLHEYAASLGYELDKAESSRRETVMRRRTGLEAWPLPTRSSASYN